MKYGEKLLVNEKYRDYVMNTSEHTWNILEGSIRSSKTVFNILAFCLYLETYDTNDELLFLACGVTDAQAKALIGECNGFGVAYYFDKNAEYKKYKNADAIKITLRRNGQPAVRWVIFAGAAKADSYKTIRGLSIEGVIGSEFDLFHKDFMEEVKRRTAAARNRKYFFDMNPNIEDHWIYKEYVDNPNLDRNYLHATLLDNPALSQERIDEITREYDPDSPYYKSAILGQRMNIEGQIYNIRDYNIINDYNPNDYFIYVTVADPGENMSGTAFLLGGLTFNNDEKQYEVHILKEYFHRNADQKNGNNIKLPKEYAEDYISFIKECQELMGKYPNKCLLDEDITFYRELQIVKGNINFSLFKYVDKIDIEERIKTDVNLLYRGKLRFHSSCKNTIRQFKNAVYDPAKIEKGKWERLDRPDLANIDCIDATEYVVQDFIKYLSR
jgi:PBSX family phage terminase large subunit